MHFKEKYNKEWFFLKNWRKLIFKLYEKGLERGRQEVHQKAIEAARKMLDKCYDIDEICELTSLTREEAVKLSRKK